ncbi:MAG: Phosphate-binding protein PstS 1 precursor [Chloroflexi bacterium ADurb.Bin180]|nr:MAG: Phosphate-binding protein PstS 1 precursor [Chloroflexi bacterium ADurb.Bin180]
MPRPTSSLFVLLLAMALATQSCGTSALAPQKDSSAVLLRLAGSTSMVPLARELCAAYTHEHLQVTCEVLAVGSDSGLELLRRGQADLAMVSRELDTDEALDSRTGRRLLNAYAIATDAIAVVVNEHNPVREMDSFTLRKLFQGRITDWAQLGGVAGEVVPLSREEGSATRTVLEERVMSGFPVSSGAVVMPASQAVVDYVAQHSQAIGYVSLGWVTSGVAVVRIDGADPSRESLQKGSYGIIRPLVLATLPAASSEATSFVQFARGLRGRAVISRLYGDPPAQVQGQP